MQLSEWSTIRKKWVKARDAAKPSVSSGAVKGVHVGPALDAVAKATQQDYRSLHTATTSLIADLTKYKAAIKTKNPALATWIDANLVTPAEALQHDIENDLKALKSLSQLYASVSNKPGLYVPQNLLDLSSQVSEAKSSLAVVAPDAAKQLTESTAYWVRIAKGFEKYVAEVRLDLPKTRTRSKLAEESGWVSENVARLRRMEAASATPKFYPVMRSSIDVPDNLLRGLDLVNNVVKAATK